MIARLVHWLGHVVFDADCAIDADRRCKRCGRAVDPRPRAWRSASLRPWRWVLVGFYLLAVYLAGMSSVLAWLGGANAHSLFYLAVGACFAWCVVQELKLAMHNAYLDGLRAMRDRIVAELRPHGIEVPR